MIDLIGRVLSYRFYKSSGFLKTLPIFLTFNVNDWCNSKCKTCFIWKNDAIQKRKEELKFDEIDKIFSNFKRLHWLTITGGEPFLRRDLVEIIRLIYDHTQPRIITIPTNAIVTKHVVDDVVKILNECPKLNLIINISMDGIGDQHDEIRGVKGNFKFAVKTFNALKNLNHPRLSVGINTVISNFNVSSFSNIYGYINENLRPDSYIAEIAENRERLYNKGLQLKPSQAEYVKAIEFLINTLKRKRSDKNLAEIIRVLRIEYYRFLLGKFSLQNYEGIASGYIRSNGEVWLSDTMPYIAGNLRETGYDFSRLWFNKKAGELRKIMDSGNYITTLANAFYVNAICNSEKIMSLKIAARITSILK